MINADDILDLACLTRAEIAAIAEHEHLGDVPAVGRAEYLMHAHKGPQAVHAMICDDIRTALHAHDPAHARALYATLHDFVRDHPEALRGCTC